MLQKSLHTEIRQCRTEKYRGKLSLRHKFLIKLRARPVQKLDLLHQLIIRILSNLCNQRRIVHGNMLLRTFLGSL